MSTEDLLDFLQKDDLVQRCHESLVRCPDAQLSKKIEELLIEAKSNGESYGGTAQLIIKNPSFGLGQPVFRKFKSDLSSAIMSLGAVVGFEIGSGFFNLEMSGTQFHKKQDSWLYGGMRGGISTGEPILGRIAFKPTSSIMDTAKKGRHDPCIIPRATSVIEAMAYICIADHFLWRQLDKMESIHDGN